MVPSLPARNGMIIPTKKLLCKPPGMVKNHWNERVPYEVMQDFVYSTYTFSLSHLFPWLQPFCFSGSPRRSCSSSHWGPLAWNLPEVFTHPHPHHTRIWDDQVSKLRNLVFFFRGNIVKVSRTRNFNKKMNRNSKSINIQIDEWINRWMNKQMNEYM